jgi:hypothetical protein
MTNEKTFIDLGCTHENGGGICPRHGKWEGSEGVNCPRCDEQLLIDLYRQANRISIRFTSDNEPIYREMTRDVHTAVGNMIQGMGIGYWNKDGEMVFYRDEYDR